MDRRAVLGLFAGAPVLVACGRDGARETSPLVPARDPVLSVEELRGMWRTPDPFLFCAHHDDAYPAGNARLGPDASLAGRNIGQDFAEQAPWRMYHGDVVPGFPQHPHRGFETVTVVRRGLVDHSDSLGAAARYGQGDVQWLTAGRGIVHAEMFPLLEAASPNPLELFQIWLNLPAVDKMAEPHFSMLWAPTVPRQVLLDDAGKSTEVTVVAGRLGALAGPTPPPKSWAARADSDVAILTLKMAGGARFKLPGARSGSNRRLFFFRGAELTIGARKVPGRSAIDLTDVDDVPITMGPLGGELLLLQGRPIGEPVARHGPFVMNTSSEIQKAYADYRATRFGGWPWPSDGPVHDRGERFARHASGRVERGT